MRKIFKNRFSKPKTSLFICIILRILTVISLFIEFRSGNIKNGVLCIVVLIIHLTVVVDMEDAGAVAIVSAAHDMVCVVCARAKPIRVGAVSHHRRRVGELVEAHFRHVADAVVEPPCVRQI